ncbi:MAG TPA: TRAP transporter large permease [Rectinemataceae bacterium]|nr:TRAP transporter large permease [Rectinemataceae bacterium]
MAVTTLAILILLGTFAVLLTMGAKIIYAIGISTVITTFYLGIPVLSVVQNLVRGMNSFSLMCVPFFILMGEIMTAGGITKRLVGLAGALVGWLRGGLGMANIVDSMFFGGISGSPTADVSSTGVIIIPMMTQAGYDIDFSSAITMASSIQGLLIPPSHNMVIYAMAAGGVSIGALFMAGAIPGIFLGITLGIYVYYISKKRNYPKGDRFEIKKAIKAILDSAWGLGTVLVVVVGVVLGVFTATESAAIACVWAFIVSCFIYKEMTLAKLKQAFLNTIKTLSIIMYLIGISAAFGWLVAYLQVPATVAKAIFALTSNKYVILLLINIFLLVCGCFMDMISTILIVTPILLPIVTGIGMSPVHFGVIMIFNLGIGLLTPPVGVILFVTSAITGLKVERLSKALLPFYGVMVATLLIVTYVPEIAMFLPNLLMGK